MKKHYCKDCMGEEFEIDYKSINNEVFTENRSNNEIDTESDMHIDTDEDMNNLNQINTNTEGNKIADKENLIKEVIDSYEGVIPEPHYSRLKTAMYNYEVEIDD